MGEVLRHAVAAVVEPKVPRSRHFQTDAAVKIGRARESSPREEGLPDAEPAAALAVVDAVAAGQLAALAQV